MTVLSMTVEYDGKVFSSEKEQGYISCKGCAFNKTGVVDHNFCACEDSDMIDDCYNKQIVWKEVKAPVINKTKEEPKFTVEQVLNTALDYVMLDKPLFLHGEVVDEAVKHIQYCLIKQETSDYQLYLELKAKYES